MGSSEGVMAACTGRWNRAACSAGRTPGILRASPRRRCTGDATEHASGADRASRRRHSGAPATPSWPCPQTRRLPRRRSRGGDAGPCRCTSWGPSLREASRPATVPGTTGSSGIRLPSGRSCPAGQHSKADGGRRHDPELIRELLAEHRGTAMNCASPAARDGIPVGTLAWWAHRERRGVSPRAPPQASSQRARSS
jgi:hypothetical protein